VGTSGASNEVEVRVDASGFGPPSAPSDLRSLVSGGAVSLSWPAVPGAAVYRLEAGSASDAADLGILTVANTSWAVAGVPPGVYYLRVRAIGPTGLVGLPSTDRQVTVGAVAPPPERPVAVRASVAGDRVALAWAPPPGPPPLRYVIEAGASATSLTLARVITPSAAAGFAFAGVPPGTYFLRVRGQNTAGEGIPSAVVRVQVP
jgi:predicted phage tail protein